MRSQPYLSAPGHSGASERKLKTMAERIFFDAMGILQGLSGEGPYLYTRPSWDTSIPVNVEYEENDLVVRFHATHYPVYLRDIPADATFELIG